MNKEIELEVTKSAFFLEDKIAKLENDNKRIRTNRPKEPALPIEPQPEQQKVQLLPYPPINPIVNMAKGWWKKGVIVYGIGIIGVIISVILSSASGDFLAFIGTIFYFISGLAMPGGTIVILLELKKAYDAKKKLKAQYTEDIRSSAEYIRSCAEIDEQNRQRQAQLDNDLHDRYTQRYEDYKKAMLQYEADVKHHKDVEIPEWTEDLTILDTALTDAKNALQELYERNIIPFQYRNISALLYLALFLGTSEYDLKTAIERYDTYVMQLQQREQIDVAKAQAQLAAEQLQNQQYANWLNEQLVDLNEKGNNTLKSISNWQKADVSVRMWDRHQRQKAIKARR